MKRFSRRKWLFLGVLAVAAAAAVGGYAYFTATGGGTGTAYIGTAGPITVTPAWPSGAYLYPGAYVTVPLTITNTSGNASALVTSVSGSVATVGSCLGSWFPVSTDPINVTLGPGASTTLNGYVSMTETNTNQDACQGGTPTVTWTVP